MNRRDFVGGVIAATVMASVPSAAGASLVVSAAPPSGAVTRSRIVRALKRYVRESRKRLKPTDGFVTVRDLECWNSFDDRSFRVQWYCRFVLDGAKPPNEPGNFVTYAGAMRITWEELTSVAHHGGDINDLYRKIDWAANRANTMTLPEDEWKYATGAYVRVTDGEVA